MQKLQLKGIFEGAKVVRGTDWDWGNQVRRGGFREIAIACL